MPELALVADALWHLRAQCEQQIRAITDAQRLCDHYRDQPETQPANIAIESALGDCERRLNALPVAEKRATAT